MTRLRHIVFMPIAIFVAVSGFIGCSKGSVEEHLRASDNQIRFSLGAAPQSKAYAKLTTGDSLNATGGFGIFAAYLPAAQTFPGDGGTKPVDLFYNIPVTRGRDIVTPTDAAVDDYPWITTPTLYWPYSGKLSFFAYAPYYAAGEIGADTLSVIKRYDEATPADRYPQIKFTPYASAAKQLDLLTGVATNKIGIITETEAPVYRRLPGYVDMDLYHQLTWVDFRARARYVKNDGNEGTEDEFKTWLEANFGSKTGYSAMVSSVKLTGILSENTGTYTPGSGHGGFTWGTPASDKYNAEYQLSVEAGELKAVDIPVTSLTTSYASIVVGDENSNHTENGLLYLLPHTLSSDAKLIVEYGIFETESKNAILIYTKTFNIGTLTSPSNEWNAGQHIRYNMILDLTNVSASTVIATVEPWGDGYTYTHDKYLE